MLDVEALLWAYDGRGKSRLTNLAVRIIRLFLFVVLFFTPPARKRHDRSSPRIRPQDAGPQ